MLALDPAIVAEEHREVPSSKLRALLASLEEVVADQHRVIVFSQFTSHLARIAEELRERGIQHSYLDGTTRERRGAAEAFRGGKAPVFLISLKAGGFEADQDRNSTRLNSSHVALPFAVFCV